MQRPTTLTVISVFMFAGAAVSAMGALCFFTVAVMAAVGSEGGEPISVAITGMGFAGGFALLALAGIAACLAMGLPEYRDWTRAVSTTAVAGALGQRVRGVLSSASHSWAAAFPSRNKNHKLSFRPSK